MRLHCTVQCTSLSPRRKGCRLFNASVLSTATLVRRSCRRSPAFASAPYSPARIQHNGTVDRDSRPTHSSHFTRVRLRFLFPRYPCRLAIRTRSPAGDSLVHRSHPGKILLCPLKGFQSYDSSARYKPAPSAHDGRGDASPTQRYRRPRLSSDAHVALPSRSLTFCYPTIPAASRYGLVLPQWTRVHTCPI